MSSGLQRTSVSDDIASNLMYEGAWGVETLSSTLDPHFLPRLEDEPARTLPEVTLQDGWEWLVITFPPDTKESDAKEIAAAAASEFGTTPEDWFLDRFEYRRDADWLHRWKRYFKPIQLSETTWICPSWKSSRPNLKASSSRSTQASLLVPVSTRRQSSVYKL